MHPKINVLLAEDEIALGNIIKESLETRGFMVDYHDNGGTAIAAYKKCKPDILVLDIMMPVKDGLSLTKEVRSLDKTIPIILLTSRSLTSDVVSGFHAGCNDYVRKPFNIEELIVRIMALVTKSSQSVDLTEEIPIGAFLFSPYKQTLKYENNSLVLTHRESSLLHMLVAKKSEVVNRLDILQTIWGNDDFFAGRSLDVFITKLRKKLALDRDITIINVRGIGYKLVF